MGKARRSLKRALRAAKQAKPVRRKGYGGAISIGGGGSGNGFDTSDSQSTGVWWGQSSKPDERAAGFDAWLTLMKRNATVATCVRLIKDEIVALGDELVPAEGVDNPDESQLQIWNEFRAGCNSIYTWEEILAESIECAVLAGFSYTEVAINDFGQAGALFDLPQSTILPVSDGNGGLNESPAFVQIIREKGGAKRVATEFSLREILWLRFGGMRTSGFNPSSPLEYLEIPINTMVESGRFINSFFESGAKMGLIIENQGWDKTRAIEMQRYYEREYSKSSKGHKPLVLYDGSTIKEPPKSFGQWAQFIDVTTFNGRGICGVLKVDPTLAGFDERGSLGGGNKREAAMQEFHDSNITPRKKMIGAQITQQLLRDCLGIFDYVYRFIPREKEVDAVKQSTLIGTYKIGVDIGVVSTKKLDDVNHIRAEISPNLKPLTSEELAAMHAAPAPVPAPVPPDAGTEPTQRARRAPRSVAEKRTPWADIQTRMVSWEEKTTAAILTPLKDIIAKTAERLGALHEAKDSQAASDLNMLPGGGQIRDAYLKALRGYVDDCVESSRAELGVLSPAQRSNDGVVDGSVKGMTDYIKRRVKSAFDALYGRITTTFNELFDAAFGSGWTRKELVDKLAEQAAGVAENDLSTIVRTHGTDVYNVARQRVGDEADNVIGFEFSAILDDRTTEICNAIDGLQLKASDPDVNRLRPPLHYNCRTIITYILQGETVKTDERKRAQVLRLLAPRFGGKASSKREAMHQEACCG